MLVMGKGVINMIYNTGNSNLSVILSKLLGPYHHYPLMK